MAMAKRPPPVHTDSCNGAKRRRLSKEHGVALAMLQLAQPPVPRILVRMIALVLAGSSCIDEDSPHALKKCSQQILARFAHV